VANAGGGEIQRGRRAEATRSHEQHSSLLDALLALHAHLGKEEMAAVATDLVGSEGGEWRWLAGAWGLS
jgi:hypothetical protein